jgi:hypothetical protein
MSLNWGGTGGSSARPRSFRWRHCADRIDESRPGGLRGRHVEQVGLGFGETDACRSTDQRIGFAAGADRRARGIDEHPVLSGLLGTCRRPTPWSSSMEWAAAGTTNRFELAALTSVATTVLSSMSDARWSDLPPAPAGVHNARPGRDHRPSPPLSEVLISSSPRDRQVDVRVRVELGRPP